MIGLNGRFSNLQWSDLVKWKETVA